MNSTKAPLAKRVATVAGIALLAVAGLSLVHPWGNLRSHSSGTAQILASSNPPEEVRNVLAQKCGDCHSNNTKWPAYSNIAPISWFIEHDVNEGREHMNLSAWEQYSIDSRIDLLAKIASETRKGEMPLKQYLLMHPDARLSDSDLALIRDWTKAERKRLMSESAKQQ